TAAAAGQQGEGHCARQSGAERFLHFHFLLPPNIDDDTVNGGIGAWADRLKYFKYIGWRGQFNFILVTIFIQIAFLIFGIIIFENKNKFCA
ncbi:hypothetical protein, partial [Intestinimonas butyriciproducens]|uniref:hypothetical protein n=2 Tax=Intestinimonas butyriciproducens TaxID=1297617 RepID=UPI003AEFEF2F